MADAITLHAVAGSAGKWAVITLQDGRPRDMVAYETRAEAVMSTRWNRDYYVYILIAPDGMQPKEAEAFLKYARSIDASTIRFPARSAGNRHGDLCA